MKSSTKIKKYKKKSFLLILAGVTMLLFIIMIELPIYSENMGLIRDIKGLESKINDQIHFQNTYAKLKRFQTNIERIKTKNKYIFSNLKNQTLFSDDVNSIMKVSQAFTKKFNKTKLKLEKFLPDLNSVGKGKNTVNIKLVFTGKLKEFFRFLFFVETNEKIKKINMIEITQNKNNKRYILDMDMTING